MIEFITNNFTTISNFVMAIATFLMVYYSKKSIDEEINKKKIEFCRSNSIL